MGWPGGTREPVSCKSVRLSGLRTVPVLRGFHLYSCCRWCTWGAWGTIPRCWWCWGPTPGSCGWCGREPPPSETPAGSSPLWVLFTLSESVSTLFLKLQLYFGQSVDIHLYFRLHATYFDIIHLSNWTQDDYHVHWGTIYDPVSRRQGASHTLFFLFINIMWIPNKYVYLSIWDTQSHPITSLWYGDLLIFW